MNAIQLELDFRSAIALALAEPEAADLRQLWLSLEPELRELSQKEQLSVAGQALCDLAEVCQRRAELMWVEWQDQHNTDGPIPDEDFLSGLVQKTMFLDISELVKQPTSHRAAACVGDEGESVVEEVSKEQALLLAGVEAEEEREKPEDVIAQQGYDEDIAAWAMAIRRWMERQGLESVRISEVIDATDLSRGKVWIAGLLSDLSLQQTKDFYSFDGLNLSLELVAQQEVA
jgi:hypothetical protein